MSLLSLQFEHLFAWSTAVKADALLVQMEYLSSHLITLPIFYPSLPWPTYFPNSENENHMRVQHHVTTNLYKHISACKALGFYQYTSWIVFIVCIALTSLWHHASRHSTWRVNGCAQKTTFRLETCSSKATKHGWLVGCMDGWTIHWVITPLHPSPCHKTL